jgi:two-component system OmpR family sensor kinase
MDGFKKWLKDSIQLQLLFCLSSAIAAVAIVAGIVSFATAFEEAHELQDDVLRQVAALVGQQHIKSPISADDAHLNASDEESRLTIQYLTGNLAQPRTASPQATLPFPLTLADGLQTLNLKDEPFRVLVKTLSTGVRLAVAQKTGVRDEIARNSALRTVMPFLLLMPLLLFIVSALVRKMFQPIALLADDIDHRGEQELHPMAENRLPSEIRPFVTAINRLLDRVARSVAAQRRFVADAAHELRSPLTALSLQAERLVQADMSDTARERLNILRQGIERARSLLDQLLTLAKAQSVSFTPVTQISVEHVFRHVLEELMPLAEAKHIDIGMIGETDVHLNGNEMHLRTLVKNLVENAIRYTPVDGRVDLSAAVKQGQTILQIQDSGPGIPLAEQERVFDPFYRVLGTEALGSGLGLSIVKTIAERMGAQIQLSYANTETRTGLSVKVLMPITATCC